MKTVLLFAGWDFVEFDFLGYLSTHFMFSNLTHEIILLLHQEICGIYFLGHHGLRFFCLYFVYCTGIFSCNILFVTVLFLEFTFSYRLLVS